MLRYGSPLNELKDLVKIDVPANGSLNELVRDTLEKGGKWHVVHYVGHTHYDPQNNVGYVFFPCPGSNVNNVEAVKIAEFALWLGEADTRFVFLSSCASAGQDFIYHLAKERVPAIMGFLWKVADAQAREYAKSFYQFLLEGRDAVTRVRLLGGKEENARKNIPEEPDLGLAGARDAGERLAVSFQ